MQLGDCEDNKSGKLIITKPNQEGIKFVAVYQDSRLYPLCKHCLKPKKNHYKGYKHKCASSKHKGNIIEEDLRYDDLLISKDTYGMFRNWDEVIFNSENIHYGANLLYSTKCTAKPVPGKACIKWKMRDDFKNQDSLCDDS